MAEQNLNNGTACFKEAVCIDAGRIYDSCSENHYPCYKSRSESSGFFSYSLVFILQGSLSSLRIFLSVSGGLSKTTFPSLSKTFSPCRQNFFAFSR